MSVPPAAKRMQVRFWLPDGSVVEYRPGAATEVTESMVPEPDADGRTRFVEATKAMAWKPRDVTIHGVHPVRHAPGFLTDEERRIKELEDEVARLGRLLTRCEEGPWA